MSANEGGPGRGPSKSLSTATGSASSGTPTRGLHPRRATSPSESDPSGAPNEHRRRSLRPVTWTVQTRVADGLLLVELTPPDDGVERALTHRIVLESKHLRAILAAFSTSGSTDDGGLTAKRRSQPANAGEPWPDHSDQELVDLVSQGWAVVDLAAHFGRTTGAISSRITRLTAIGLIPISTAADHD